MGFFGLKTSKEVEAEKRKAAETAVANNIRKNATNLDNLAKGSQIKFAIPYFDVFDPRLMDTGVPVSVHGSIVYAIDDMDLFQSMNKTEGYSDDAFQTKLRSTVTKFVKGVVANAPTDAQIPLVQLERKIMDISQLVQNYVIPQVEKLFAISVRSLDITNINIDKNSRGFRELKAYTADLEKENIMAKHNANLSNFELQNDLQQDQLRMQSSLNLDAMQRQQEMNLGGQEEMQRMQLEMQRIQLENQRETLRIQREEMQRAAKLQTEQTFLSAHQTNLNAAGMNNAFDNEMEFKSMPQMPAMGGGMSKMSMPQMPPAVPQVQYMIGVNGQQAGPFDWNQLQQLVQQGQLTTQSYVWKQGMAQWDFAGNVMELAPLFQNAMPQMPGMPPMM